MDKKTALVVQLKEFKTDLKSSVPVKKMIFFGSRASGRPHKYSDIDLIIVSSKFRGKKSFKRSIGFYKYWKLDYPVDFLCYTPEEFNKLAKKTTIVRESLKHGIEI